MHGTSCEHNLLIDCGMVRVEPDSNPKIPFEVNPKPDQNPTKYNTILLGKALFLNKISDSTKYIRYQLVILGHNIVISPKCIHCSIF